VEGEFSGICPKCLAGLMTTDPGETEASFRTENAKIPIDTIRPPLKPGASFKGFEVLEVLGQGGMGVVYKARQQSLNRLVALKLLNSQLATSEEFAARFDREAKVLASLNHPNVVQVFDFGKEDGLFYLVMEHVDGPTLEDVMKKKGDPANFPRAVRDVAKGLERVHQAGLVHRDVKPSNILMAKDGTAKISDFGLAIETEGSQKLTQSGMFVGTPHYVSPEHAQGKKVDGRSDLYSLGVILFEGYAGRPPFQAPSAAALLLARERRRFAASWRRSRRACRRS
jgi:serine/threonine-protein kinase